MMLIGFLKLGRILREQGGGSEDGDKHSDVFHGVYFGRSMIRQCVLSRKTGIVTGIKSSHGNVMMSLSFPLLSLLSDMLN